MFTAITSPLLTWFDRFEHAGDGINADSTVLAAAASLGSQGLAQGVTTAQGSAAGCQLVRQVKAQLQSGLYPTGIIRDRLVLPATQARSLMGTPALQRSYTFIAPGRQAANLAADTGTQHRVKLADSGFTTMSGFTAFRKAAGLQPGATVTVAACATSPDHLHMALASVDERDTGAAPPASFAVPAQQRQRRGKMLRPTASGPCTVVVALRAMDGLRLPKQLLR